MDEIKEKEITVTNLQSKTISPRPGQTYKAFTVYQIVGNDGITYETPNKEYFAARKIGETLPIKYTVSSKTSNGKVYTSYRLSLPSKEGIQLELAKKEILYRIGTMEKNIIAAIQLSMGEPKIKGPKDVPEPKKDPAPVVAEPAVATEPAEGVEDMFAGENPDDIDY